MKNSITSNKKSTIKLWAIIFWLLAWQGLSMYIGREILLVSPFSVFMRLSQLIQQPSFWTSILFSLQRITTGFFLATFIGIVFATLAARYMRIEELLEPFVLFVKATPVASIIILLLIWFSSKNLAIVISFLMVMPIMYTNVLSGIKNTDAQLLEMATVFNMSKRKKIRYIYLFQVLPFFKAACLLGLSLSWKSGVAAEIIGTPRGSIGANLHQARILLMTPDLFAWTITIILISTLIERLFMFSLNFVIKKLEGV